MKKLFIKFLKDRDLLAEFEYNLKEYGFHDRHTIDDLCRTVHYNSFVSRAFNWKKTSRHEDGDLTFWLNLAMEWIKYVKP
jgi:hypothetical protein